MIDVYGKRNESGWISVKDRLPEFEVDVLYTDGKNIYLGWLEDTYPEPYWTHYDYMEDKDVTHWMPLPEIPKDK